MFDKDDNKGGTFGRIVSGLMTLFAISYFFAIATESKTIAEYLH